MKNYISLLLIALTVTISLKSQDLSVKKNVMVFNLNQTIERARNYSPDAVAARHSFRSSYWSYRNFKATFLPSLSFSSSPNLSRSITKVDLPDGTEKYVKQNSFTVGGSFDISQEFPLTGGTFSIWSNLQRMELLDNNYVSFNSSLISIGYSQALFGYNKFKWTRKIEPLRYEIAKKDYVQALEDVSGSAVSKFYNLALAQSSYEMADFNYREADTLYNISKRRYEIGTIIESDLLQIEIKKLSAETNRMDALISMDMYRQDLCLFLGLDKDIEIVVDVDAEVPDLYVDPEIAFEYFKENNPSYLNLDVNELNARSNLDYSKKTNRFNTSFSVSYGLSNTGEKIKDVYNDPTESQQVRVSIMIPILNWGQNKGARRMAESSYELTKIQIEQNRNSLEMAAKRLVMQFNLQSERVKIAAKRDTIAARQYDITYKLYLMEKTSVLELNNSMLEKDSARSSYISALNSFWASYYNLRSTILYDFEKNLPLHEDYTELSR